MKTTRRGFLAGMLALGAAPAIVKSSSLMKLATPPKIVVPDWRLMVQPMYSHVQNLPILSRLGHDFDGDTISSACIRTEELTELLSSTRTRIANSSAVAWLNMDKSLTEYVSSSPDVIWRPKLNRIIVGNSLGSKRVL